ncbi:MAG: hypothetical protein AB1646_18585 [Thermodesulfobacteriota bacterium]
MKTIELPMEPAPKIEELLDLADQGPILLKFSDGREFILAEIDDLAQEIERIRGNPELLAFLASRSGETDNLSLEQVKERLGL